MSRLRIYADSNGATALLETSDHARIADELGQQDPNRKTMKAARSRSTPRPRKATRNG